MQGLWLGTWARFLTGNRLAPFVPTPYHVAQHMLELARVKSSDYVFDLGCGDGRLLIAAAQRYGARGFGAELNLELVKEAQAGVEREGFSHLIKIVRQDAKTVDLSEATVVALYLSVGGNHKLLPRLQEQLPPGARVVSFCWPFEALKPSATRTVDGIPIYLYRLEKADR